MGEPLKNRKRKFNKVAANPKNNKVKDAEMTVEDANENDVSKAKTKQVKKNKMAAFAGIISEMPIESKNEIDISEKKSKKAKKNKNKIVETPAEEENVSEAKLKKTKKKKFVEMSNETTESDLGKPKAKKSKKNKSVKSDEQNGNEDNETALKKNEVVETSGDGDKGITEEMIAQYPILKDEEVIKKYQAVHLSKNQKGRIRAQLKEQLKGTSEAILPDAINIKIQAILKTDNPNWMKVRILFNMLKLALRGERPPIKKEKPVKKENLQKENGKDEKPEQKVKGPKRYVVFMGNLPLDISKEKILEHFSDLSDKIKDVRIPKPLENKKSAIAYVEVADELTYELTLSKHHTMLDNRRINVLYSTQKESKISKTEAKGKAAKLVAMQKSGQLAGSVPLSKKRSARRKKMKLALKKAQEAADRGV